MKFGESEAKLESGEVLVLYTDGITESRKNGHLFGFDGLVGVLEGCKSCTPREIAELVYERAKNYAEGVVRDDVALIVVRRH
jgi:sigma-B regulation protein RsbU (phosphoserine phosphatase)